MNQVIPDTELDLYVNTVDKAVELAAVGRLADGYGKLEYGLERARAARDDGEEWGAELADRYRAALENYCQSYGVRVG